VNPEGEVVAQAEHIPVHLGSFRVGVRNLLNWLDREGVELNQGDVVLLNDPYISGTHLNNVMVMEPTHASNRLVSYVVNNVDSGFAEITYFGFRVSVTNVAVLISAG
jgi:N-methylhydantoinase B/acetone carboxylase, alpha subunit